MILFFPSRKTFENCIFRQQNKSFESRVCNWGSEIETELEGEKVRERERESKSKSKRKRKSKSKRKVRSQNRLTNSFAK